MSATSSIASITGITFKDTDNVQLGSTSTWEIPSWVTSWFHDLATEVRSWIFQLDTDGRSKAENNDYAFVNQIYMYILIILCIMMITVVLALIVFLLNRTLTNNQTTSASQRPYDIV